MSHFLGVIFCAGSVSIRVIALRQSSVRSFNDYIFSVWKNTQYRVEIFVEIHLTPLAAERIIELTVTSALFGSKLFGVVYNRLDVG